MVGRFLPIDLRSKKWPDISSVMSFKQTKMPLGCLAGSCAQDLTHHFQMPVQRGHPVLERKWLEHGFVKIAVNILSEIKLLLHIRKKEVLRGRERWRKKLFNAALGTHDSSTLPFKVPASSTLRTHPPRTNLYNFIFENISRICTFVENMSPDYLLPATNAVVTWHLTCTILNVTCVAVLAVVIMNGSRQALLSNDKGMTDEDLISCLVE